KQFPQPLPRCVSRLETAQEVWRANPNMRLKIGFSLSRNLTASPGMTALGLLAWALACWTGGGVASAQSGEFVIPEIRANNGTRFAYWDGFSFDPVNGGNYNYANPPAL